MKVKQEPKYGIAVPTKFDDVTAGSVIDDAARLCNRATGEPIPDDEPVFILRAKDVRAVMALVHYGYLCTRPNHKIAVKQRIQDFKRFAAEHPERMKEPDTKP